MPTLNWLGKEKVVNHHREVPYRVLERVPEKGVLDSHGSDRGNMIIHGDNLETLKALLPEFEGKVDCVYIDPPYNTGTEGWVYNDNVNDPRIRKWLGNVVGDEDEDFSRHDKWLCMMYPRLQLLRKLLATTGVIFISISDIECANLTLICDEIFTRSCFVADISWQRNYSARNDSKGIPAEVEHMLVYSKAPNWQPLKLGRTAEMDSKYKNPDNDVMPWTSSDAFAPGASTHQGMVYAIQHPFTGEFLYPYNGGCWRYQQDQMLEYMNGWCPYVLRDLNDSERRAEVCGIDPSEVRKGVKSIVLAQSLEESKALASKKQEEGPWPRFYFTRNGKGGIRRKTYIDNVEGRLPTNYWPYSEVGHTDEAKKELKAIFGGTVPFDTPKPTRLIERVLQIATDENSIVLDSFAGSGTTAHAVLKLNARDGGNRRFILTEMCDYADSITAQRVKTAISGYEAPSKTKTRLFEKQLTARNLKDASKFYEQALEVVSSASGDGYDTIEGPKMLGPFIVVEGVVAKGEWIPGIDSGFSYYELGPALFLGDGSLNPEVSFDDLKRYVWYSETRAPYVDHATEHPYLLGECRQAVYYLAFESDDETALTYDLLRTLPRRGMPTVIYADRCAIALERLDEMGIVFKQVPRKIARM